MATVKAATPQISAGLGDSIINDLLAGLSYPLTVKFPSARSAEPETDLPAEFEWAPERANANAVEDEADIGKELVGAAIGGYLDAVRGGQRADRSDRELYDLIAKRAGEDPSATEETVRSALEADSAKFAPELVAALSRVSSVSIRWVKVTVLDRPSATLGNPIRIGKLKFKVQAKVRICVRIFGRKICKDITTPDVEFAGRELRVALESRGLQVWATPSAKDIDIVIKVKILGIKFTFKIGITGIVNQYLKGQSVMVFDARALGFSLPSIGRAYGITAVSIPAAAGATTVNLSGAYTKL